MYEDNESLAACSPFYFLSLQGKTLRLRRILNDQIPCLPPGRGKVTGFSHQSRNRLLRLLNSIDWKQNARPLFITLTFPDSHHSPKFRDRRNRLNYFIKLTERFLGRTIGVLWRQEWIRRKTGKYQGKLRPHYHLLVFGVTYLDKDVVRNSWRKAINYDEADLATDVKRITGVDGAIRYIAKYLAKNPSLDIGTYLDTNWTMGRFWGILHKELIPMHPEQLVEVKNPQTLGKIIVEGSRILDREPLTCDGGFTIFGDKGVDLFRKLGKSC